MNLLPLTEKRVVRSEYHKRLAVVGLNLLAILVLIAGLPVVVSYMASSYEIADLEHELALASNTNISEGVDNNLNIIKDTNGKLSILSRDYSQGLAAAVSDIFYSIINQRRNVRLTSLSYDKITVKQGEDKKIGHRVVIKGLADNRQTLQNFVDALERGGIFTSVDLPVSDLIASKNINFAVTAVIIK